MYTNSPLFIVHCTHWYSFGKKNFCKVQSGQNIAFPDAGQSQFCKKFTKIQKYHKHKYKNITNTNTKIPQTQIWLNKKIASLASHIESMLSQSSKKFAKWRCHDAVFFKNTNHAKMQLFWTFLSLETKCLSSKHHDNYILILL